MKKITTSLLVVIMSTTFSFGQTQKATTENGKKVILNSDGRWKYADTIKTVQTKLDPNDCSNWISTETDKVEGRTATAAKDIIIVSTNGGKKGLGILMMKGSKGGVILVIQPVGASNCIDEGAKINILFTDGSRLVLNNDGKFNCKGMSTVFLGEVYGRKSELEELKIKKIQTMRAWTSDGFVEEDFTVGNQQEFLNVINCLTK